MIQIHAAFGHDLFEVPIRNGKADVEVYGIQDHVFWKMSAFEIDHGMNANLR